MDHDHDCDGTHDHDHDHGHDDWDAYFSEIDDSPASILVNLAARDAAPDAEYTWLVLATVSFQSPDENGFPSSEESERLDPIEDSLITSLESTGKARFVGRITTQGRRTLSFYATSGEGWSTVSAAASTPSYSFEIEAQPDEDWEFYINMLYPGAVEMQFIQNRRLMEQLVEHGDQIETPRPVTHWLYFATTDGRDEFVEEAAKEGFSLVPDSFSVDEANEHPYGVSVQRDDAVDWESANDTTLVLLRLAEQSGGSYDGWETALVTDDPDSDSDDSADRPSR